MFNIFLFSSYPDISLRNNLHFKLLSSCLHQVVNGVSKSTHSDEVKSTDPVASLVRQISQARLMAIRKKRSTLTNSFSTQDNGNTHYTLMAMGVILAQCRWFVMLYQSYLRILLHKKIKINYFTILLHVWSKVRFGI